jgi:polysaccharide biosynthesis transport protein
MNLDQVASLVWRRKLVFLTILLACVGAVVALTLTLPKTYRASATLLVGGEEIQRELSLNTNLGEQLARTYTTLAANPNVADRVRDELPLELSRSELLGRMSFSPVQRTQLLQISGEGSSPAEAKLVTNSYASVFVDHVDEQFQRGDTQARLLLTEPAALPTAASKPDPPLYIGMGSILSLLLALGVVLLQERLDRRIRVAEEDESILDQPILARIPKRVRLMGEEASRVEDAFRLLKTNIDFRHQGMVRTVAVTSPGPGEGKTTVAASLATASAADGERVVLIEADLRRPGLFAMDLMQDIVRPEVGLSNYLVGAGADEIVAPHPAVPGLSVICAGPTPSNPTALLRSRKFDDLLVLLLRAHDRVVIDTPPISLGADASVLAARAEGTLYVIDASRTSKSSARAGLNQLRTIQTNLLGVVVNRAATPSFEGYYAAPAPRPVARSKAREPEPQRSGLSV